MKDIVVIYHGNCSDGFGGAWAAWKKFGDQADYLSAHHLKPNQPEPLADLKDKTVYFIDFIYPKEITERIIRENKAVTAIDHHITMREVVALTKDFIFDNEHSGAVLAWNYFHSEKEIPKLLRHIEDFDLWKFKLPNTKEIMAFLEITENNFELWDKLAQDLENEGASKSYLEQGKAILAYQKTLVNQLAETAELVSFEGHSILVANAPHALASSLGHVLYQKNPPMSVIWNQQKDRKSFSLRSDGTVDVGRMAQKYGGGGHKTAAGFRLEPDAELPWIPIK